MILNYKQCHELNQAMNMKDLKIKSISGENWVKIMKVKSILNKKFTGEMGELENETIKALGFENTPQTQFTVEQATLIQKKIKPAQDEFKLEIESNFLPQDEFKTWVENQDVFFATILAEYFLKDFNTETKQN